MYQNRPIDNYLKNEMNYVICFLFMATPMADKDFFNGN